MILTQHQLSANIWAPAHVDPCPQTCRQVYKGKTNKEPRVMLKVSVQRSSRSLILNRKTSAVMSSQACDDSSEVFLG